jgi:hypothetical protein
MLNWIGCEKKRSGIILWYYIGIHLQKLRKTTKNLSQDSRSPGQDFKPGPPEYEAGFDHDFRCVSNTNLRFCY